MKRPIDVISGICLALATQPTANAQDSIIHDGEYEFLKRQHGRKWAAEDKEIDAKLAEIRKNNGGKPPNILYVLIDDVSFGQMGNPAMNYVMGVRTPCTSRSSSPS